MNIKYIGKVDIRLISLYTSNWYLEHKIAVLLFLPFLSLPVVDIDLRHIVNHISAVFNMNWQSEYKII